MIGIDSNVLLRLLVRDDARQTAQAAALVRRALESDERLLVPDVVWCETVWVLTTAYRFTKAEVTPVLEGLLRARELAFEDSDVLARALAAYRDGRGDVADYVIRERARRAGCSSVATFDKKLLKEQGFERP